MKNLYDYERTQSATTDLPFGALKNESSPGKQDGTDIVAEHIQDLAYSLYQVLQLAGINPNGELEDGNNKTQFIESLTNIGVFRYSDKTSYNYGVFAWQVIGNTFTLYRSLKNSNSDDVNNNESWLKILEIGADNKINFNVDTNILGLSANPSLSNLSEAGEDRLNVSKMYETGAVSNDTKGFKELLKRAHSTFDKSKFEVVGTPTITEDGVVNKFTYTNYPSIANNVVNKLENNSWKIRFAGISPQSNTTLNITGINTQPIGKLNIGWINGTANFFLQIKNSTTEKATFVTTNKPNTHFVGYAEFDGTNNYTIAISFDDGKTFSKNTMTAEEKVNFEGVNLPIATGSDSATGSIDLKSIAIWAGGVPVFNGNKTGLYVAKPDNYTVEGSPTISEDGLASGFLKDNESGSDNSLTAVKPPIKLSTFQNKSWKICCDFTLPSQFPIKNAVLYTLGQTTSWVSWSGALRIISGGVLSIQDRFGTSSENAREEQITQGSLTNYGLELGKSYTYTHEFNNNTGVHTYSFSKNGNIIWKTDYTPTTENKNNYAIINYSDEYINIGNGWQNVNNKYYGWTGTIDLNEFKIYVDGNLVYQPCLKIPYTEAFEHSKVVGVAYRNRVQDLYEQTGEALFYTIDEQNQNFTLPMGDIYGMITKNREILDIVYPIGRPMPEENNVLLDNEVWLEGATVNIVDYPKLFKIYGTKYGGDGTTTFKLPDMRGRTLWGSPDGSNGYIESKLPNIKGNVHLEGDGGSRAKQTSTASGAFNWINPGTGASFENTGGGQPWFSDFNFDASRSNSIYSNSAKIVQPPAFKVRWKTRFE